MQGTLPRIRHGLADILRASLKGLHTFLKGRKRRTPPRIREEELFEQGAKEQFQELKKKGLSIPIFTL